MRSTARGLDFLVLSLGVTTPLITPVNRSLLTFCSFYNSPMRSTARGLDLCVLSMGVTTPLFTPVIFQRLPWEVAFVLGPLCERKS